MSEIVGLEKELLDLIVKTCECDPTGVAEMTVETPVLGPESPLFLDSLDAVEIVSMIQSKFGVRIANRQTSIEVLNSLQSMADYIRENR